MYFGWPPPQGTGGNFPCRNLVPSAQSGPLRAAPIDDKNGDKNLRIPWNSGRPIKIHGNGEAP